MKKQPSLRQRCEGLLHCPVHRQSRQYSMLLMLVISLAQTCLCVATSKKATAFHESSDRVASDNTESLRTLQHTRATQERPLVDDDENFASCADGKDHHICYHGGECKPIGDQYHCECANAKENGTMYVGKWCHLPPETFCDESMFCVNGGTCPTDGTASSCDCSDNFVGKHCEFHKGDVTFVEDDNVGGGDSGNNNQPQESCPMDCQNGGVCTSTAPNSYVCQCAEGFMGANCEEAQDLETPCGPNGDVCHHGSMCIRNFNGAYACDCTTTIDKDVVGRWCQYKATSYCDADRQVFCVNGGTCIEGANEDGTFSCSCDETKWTGPLCEFLVDTNGNKDEEELTSENCTLTCLNGGMCHKEAKQSLDKEGNNGSVSIQGLEHCVCPKGYTGISCEHEYEECGKGEHYCLHGSTCVALKDSSKDDWKCECPDGSSAGSDFFAGSSCEHHSTTICADASSMNGPYNPSKVSFCVNDGVCVSTEENGQFHSCCRCPPGYTGAHCELYDRVRESSSSSKGQESAAILFVCFVLGVLLVFLILVAVMRWRGLKQQQQKYIADRITSSHMRDITSAWQSAVMQEMEYDPDFDEDDLEEVELL